MTKKIITIAHQKGGVGKSTIALNLSVMLDAVIVDLDTQKTITQINKIRSKTGFKEMDLKSFSDFNQFTKFVENYNYKKNLIIDCGGFDSGFNNVAISYADLVITPVSDERIELLGLQKFEEVIKKVSKITNKKVDCRVLLNKINPRVKNFTDLQDFISQSNCFKLLSSVIRRRVVVSNITPLGLAVSEGATDSAACAEFKSLINEINNI